MKKFLKYLWGIGIIFLIISSNMVVAKPIFNIHLLKREGKDSVPSEFKKRALRYKPDGTDFVIINGNKRYNRALYGTHTAFRVEAGDLPEFALYFPGIGGDMKLGVITTEGTKWFNDFDTVEARYRPGTMIYRLKDASIGHAEISLQLLALSDREGMILKAEVKGNKKPLQLICVYGGASGIHPHRNGDLGADPPSIFYLTPEHAKGNQFSIHKNIFDLTFKDRKESRTLQGIAPPRAALHVGDAAQIQSPYKALQAPESVSTPALVINTMLANNDPVYFEVQQKNSVVLAYHELPALFLKSKQYFTQLAQRVQIQTPDPFMNTIGGAISVAADAIWESPAYLHGAVAWRMWLPGWRGAYVADDLGWHDRAKTEFNAYNNMQLTAPDTTIPFPDPSENLARQKEKIGVGIYNRGYITRYPEGKLVTDHYDMNLVYVDEMIRHFLWTGDTAFMRQCWPVIKRHLAWERRNFDHDNNGLFDAYACIWASDALEYSGGDVAYSSAYNYFENKMVARIATLLGKNPASYLKEAGKIKHAMDSILWMPYNGWYAEYKDRSGLRLLHPEAGLWTIYQTIDSGVPDAFQKYQLLRYVDKHIPHIPIKCDALKGNYYMLSTTDWMPYTWSVNNVAMAEMTNTALAYWEGGRKETAYKIFKSLILESMYLGSSPGNFEQLSSYDRYRGEVYRDFADPIGICSRALVEGLFGICPNALADTLTIQPGFPQAWDHASIHLPDIDYSYKREDGLEVYTIVPNFKKNMNLKLILNIHNPVNKVEINGVPADWEYAGNALGNPRIIIEAAYQKKFHVKIEKGHAHRCILSFDSIAISGNRFVINSSNSKIISIKDPQHTLSHVEVKDNQISASVIGIQGWHTLFIKLRQGDMNWWEPVNFVIRPACQIVSASKQDASGIYFSILNNTSKVVSAPILISTSSFSGKDKIHVLPHIRSKLFFVPAKYLFPGSNKIEIKINNTNIDTVITNWNLRNKNWIEVKIQMISLASYFNDKVINIFKNKYLSPRPNVPTLQLPEQGIGNWCSPLVDPEIDDQGLRLLAKDEGYFTIPGNIPFATPSAARAKNIIFTSQWNNYPDKVTVPLHGKAAHAYFLMAGSTDPMQSRLINGNIIVCYHDGTSDSLLLKNPGTWWPIAQDYSYDKYAFHCSVPVPWRVHLKTGVITRHFDHYKPIKGLTNLGIPGGSATVFDMPLNKNKELKSLELQTCANDVNIGLMSVTLLRNKN